MFGNSQMGGLDTGFPDVCLTPTPAGPVPIPYPNLAPGPTAVPAQVKVMYMFTPAHNMATMAPLTNGDNGGVATGVAVSRGAGVCEGRVPAAHLEGDHGPVEACAAVLPQLQGAREGLVGPVQLALHAQHPPPLARDPRVLGREPRRPLEVGLGLLELAQVGDHLGPHQPGVDGARVEGGGLGRLLLRAIQAPVVDQLARAVEQLLEPRADPRLLGLRGGAEARALRGVLPLRWRSGEVEEGRERRDRAQDADGDQRAQRGGAPDLALPEVVAQRLAEVARAVEAVHRVLRQAAQADRLQLGVDLGPQLANRPRALLEGRNDHLVQPAPRARRAPGEREVEHATQAVDVGGRADLGALAPGLLGREEARRAEEGAAARQPLHFVQLEGQAEVGEERAPLAVEEHVVGLDVAVQDPLVVGVLEGLAQPQHHRRGLLLGERPGGPHALAEGVPLDVVHDEERGSVGLDPGVAHAHDRGVVEPTQGADLALHALGDRRLGEPAAQELERDDLVLGGVEGAVDEPGASLAEGVQFSVALQRTHAASMPETRADRPLTPARSAA